MFTIQDTYYTSYKILYDITNKIPQGVRYHVTTRLLEGKEEEEEKSNKAKLHRTILKLKIQKKRDLKGNLMAA